MRCSKCGYHSFDYLDNCKKCGADLTERKLQFRYQGYVAPVVTAPPPVLEEVAADIPDEAEAESDAIDFGFGILGEETPEERAAAHEPDSLPAANPADSPALFADDALPETDFGDFGAGSFGVDDPSAIDLAADIGLSLDQPFGEENESLPSELPELDNRDGDFF